MKMPRRSSNLFLAYDVLSAMPVGRKSNYNRG